MLSIFNKLSCLIICTIFASNLTLTMQTQQPQSRKIVVKFHGTTFPITPEVLLTTKMLNEFVEECSDDEKKEKDKKSTLEIDITPKCPHSPEQFGLFLTIAQYCALDQNYSRYFSLWPKKAGILLDLANRFDNQQVLRAVCKKIIFGHVNDKVLTDFLFDKGFLHQLIKTTPPDIQNFILKKLLIKKFSDLETELIEKNTQNLKGHSDSVNCLIQLKDGTLASGSSDLTIKIWDPNKSIMLQTLNGHSNVVKCLIQLTDGTLASGASDNTIKIWNSKQSNALKTLIGHSNRVNCLIQLKDGTLASCSRDGTIKIWDLKQSIALKTLIDHFYPVFCLIQLKDGTLGSLDRTIKIWNLEQSTVLQTITNHSDLVNCLIQLKDGTLAAGAYDCTIKIWNFKQSTALQTLIGHSYPTNCLIQLKDGTLASASGDNTIKIWDLNKSNAKQTLTGHSDWICCLIQLKDGTVASGAYDHTIKIWPLPILKTVTFEELLFIFAMQKIVMQQKQKLELAKKEFAHAKKIYAKLPQDVKNTLKSYVTE